MVFDATFPEVFARCFGRGFETVGVLVVLDTNRLDRVILFEMNLTFLSVTRSMKYLPLK